MCLTMIDPASSWFQIVELPVTTDAFIPMDTKGQRGTTSHNNTTLSYFDKSSAMISNLVNKTWFSTMEVSLNFTLNVEAFCKSYGIKRKPTSVKKPQSNAILERVHQVITLMLCTAELDMANTVDTSDIDALC